jgi:TolA-binding protein
MLRPSYALLVAVVLSFTCRGLAQDDPSGAETESAAGAQLQPDTGGSSGELAPRVQRLENVVQNLAAHVSSLRSDVSQISDNLTSVTQDLEKLREQTQSQLTQQETILQRLGQLEQQTQDQLTQQQQILDQITRSDSAGNRLLNLAGMMDKNPEYRSEVRDAVFNRRGVLRVTNRMATDQRISVYHGGAWRDYGVAPGETEVIEVEAGTVSTRLPSQPIVNWTVAGPDYRQSIEIAPEVVPQPMTAYYAPLPLYSSSRPVDVMTVWP